MKDRLERRVRRILDGWTASFVLVLLSVTQQILLVPVFLHFWSSAELAAWLSIYSVGYLVLMADCGLQMRAINGFLGVRTYDDGDDRTAAFFSRMLRLYIGLALAVAVIVLVGAALWRPSIILGFSVEHFDVAFVVMIMGMITTLPTNLAGALYRARGYYGRIVKIQCWATGIGQVAQIVAIILSHSLLGVTVAYALAQVLIVGILYVDLPRIFPFIRLSGEGPSLDWIVRQFRRAFPFAIVTATESAITYAPVLLVSFFVADRVAVAQWGLTRMIVGLLRGLSFQMTLPLAAELGQDYAADKKQQVRNLYAQSSVVIGFMVALVISGLLAFWQDFFAIWTHDTIPYDRALTMILLLGTSVAAPSIVALSYANYTDRGPLLALTKGLQLATFLLLSFILIPRMDALGAALAIVLSDFVIQFGIMTVIILRQTLARPLQHVGFLAAVVGGTIVFGWGMGEAIRWALPWSGFIKFIVECGLWLAIVALCALPLAKMGVRAKLIALIPS